MWRAAASGIQPLHLPHAHWEFTTQERRQERHAAYGAKSYLPVIVPANSCPAGKTGVKADRDKIETPRNLTQVTSAMKPVQDSMVGFSLVIELLFAKGYIENRIKQPKLNLVTVGRDSSFPCCPSHRTWTSRYLTVCTARNLRNVYQVSQIVIAAMLIQVPVIFGSITRSRQQKKSKKSLVQSCAVFVPLAYWGEEQAMICTFI